MKLCMEELVRSGGKAPLLLFFVPSWRQIASQSGVKYWSTPMSFDFYSQLRRTVICHCTPISLYETFLYP